MTARRTYGGRAGHALTIAIKSASMLGVQPNVRLAFSLFRKPLSLKGFTTSVRCFRKAPSESVDGGKKTCPDDDYICHRGRGGIDTMS